VVNQTIPGLNTISAPSSAGLLWVSDPNASPQDRSLTLTALWNRLMGLYTGSNWQTALAAVFGTKQRSVVITSGALGALTVVTDTEYYLTAATTATLPASPSTGQKLTFKNRGAFTTTISAAAGQTIGSTSSTAFALYAMEDYVTLVWDGVAIWEVVATNGPVVQSSQTALTNCNNSSAWTAIGNGLTLGTVAPGLYDLEMDLDLGVTFNVGANLSVSVGNATTPISSIVAAASGSGTASPVFPCHVHVKNYVLGSSATIQGIYYSNNSSNVINYASGAAVGKITARRVG
jgi:hypothetical protein